MRRRFAAFLLSASCLASTAWAQPIAAPAMEYASVCKPPFPPQLDRTRDWSRWEGRSTTFPAKDLYDYGKLFYYGDAKTDQQPELAAKLFHHLSGGDSPYRARSLHYLASMMIDGKGMARDPDRAKRLFQSALEGGVSGSAYRLGKLSFEAGDKPRAEEYFKLGASRNSAPAALALALAYEKGEIAPPSPKAATDMTALAQQIIFEKLARGVCGAAYEIGTLYLAQPDAPSQEAAHSWLKAAAATGDTKAMLRLAEYHLAHDLGEDGLRIAAQYWQRAADAGSHKGQGRIGAAYLRGEGVPQDTAKAYYWLERAARHEDASPSVLLKLAKMYVTGEGAPRDAGKALELYRRAALRRQPAVLQPEGMWYLGEKRRQEGLKTLRAAAKKGNADAMFEIGNAYSAGDGVPFSLEEARQWWKKSAEAGNPHAKELMKHLAP